MAKKVDDVQVHLSRRERQIMDVLYGRGEASVSDVQQALPDSPGYSAVRALLRKLVDKGHVVYREDGPRYIYRAVVAKEKARDGAIERLVSTFFSGSAADAVVSLLGRSRDLSAADLEQIEAALDRLRKQRD